MFSRGRGAGLVVLIALTAATACSTEFTGYTTDTPGGAAYCDEVRIHRENGHRCGEHIVEFDGVRAEHAELEPRPGTDLIVRVPSTASTGPLTVRQRSAFGCMLFGMLDSPLFDLGTFRVTGVAPRGPCNAWWHADAAAVPAGVCPSTTSGPVRVGDPAPNFTLVDQHGDSVELCQFYGRVVILHLFTAWCGHCPAQTRDLEDRYWLPHAAEGLVVIGIMEEGEPGEDAPPEAGAAWAARNGLTYPLLVDQGRSQLELYFGGRASPPQMVVIDRDMRVHFVDSCGMADPDTGDACSWSRALDLL